MHREVGDGDVRGVERAHDPGELLAAGVQAHGDRAGGALGDELAERLERGARRGRSPRRRAA